MVTIGPGHRIEDYMGLGGGYSSSSSSSCASPPSDGDHTSDSVNSSDGDRTSAGAGWRLVGEDEGDETDSVGDAELQVPSPHIHVQSPGLGEDEGDGEDEGGFTPVIPEDLKVIRVVMCVCVVSSPSIILDWCLLFLCCVVCVCVCVCVGCVACMLVLWSFWGVRSCLCAVVSLSVV